LAFASDILGSVNTIKFIPEPDIAERLKKLCQVTNLRLSELVNVLLDWPLTQIVDHHDSGMFQPILQSFEYNTKEEALAAIAGYERFSFGNDHFVYCADAKPARTRDGHWEILFKGTHPWDEAEGARLWNNFYLTGCGGCFLVSHRARESVTLRTHQLRVSDAVVVLGAMAFISLDEMRSRVLRNPGIQRKPFQPFLVSIRRFVEYARNSNRETEAERIKPKDEDAHHG